jgi:hypothetical protein
MPIGIITLIWPNPDIAKALFFIVFAYIIGHILTVISSPLVSQMVFDSSNKLRMRADLFLDKNDKVFSNTFKERLAKQVSELFGLNLYVSQDSDGENDISKDRQAAFLQARSFLIAKKTASAVNYAEQIEGLFVMMRGLGCAFFAGALYLVGWGVSCDLKNSDLHINHNYIYVIRNIFFIVIIFALIISSVAYYLESRKKKAGPFLEWCKKKAGPFIEWRKKKDDPLFARFLFRWCLIVALIGSGFIVGYWHLQHPVFPKLPYFEHIIWFGALLSLIVAVKCFSSYRRFSNMFAQTVWRDFSAYYSFQENTTRPSTTSTSSSEAMS